MSGKATRLYPLPPREISAHGIYGDLELPPPEHRRGAARPYVVINMVSSIDGKTVIKEKASRIGSETDRRTMRTLRSKADAVMIGAGTLRAERLSLGLDECYRGQPQPLAVVVTRTGNVPLETNLIATGQQEILVITTKGGVDSDSIKRLRDHARVLQVGATPSGAVNLEEALKVLKTDYAVNLLLVEGGPRLNHSLIRGLLADELFLTLAPKLLGGTADSTLTILRGDALPEGTFGSPELLSAHVAGGELFLRYSVLR